MAKINYDKIVDYSLWTQLKAKFGFDPQTAKDIWFKNECMMFQNIDTFMVDPVADAFSVAVTGTGNNLLYTVPAGERWRVHEVTWEYNVQVNKIDHLMVYDPDGVYVKLRPEGNVTVQKGHVRLPYDLILEEAWHIDANTNVFAGNDTLYTMVYYEKEDVE